MSRFIAIVGLACRYPDARSPDELWQAVLSQRRAFRRIPPERLRLEDYYSEDGRAPDSTYSTEAALIEGYEFDRVRFRVARRSYRTADPAHWLALDVASQVLEDAGWTDGRGLDRDTAGVLVGNSLTGEVTRAGLMRLRWPYVRRRVEAALAGEGWSRERLASFVARLEAGYKEPFVETTEESLAGGLSNTIAGRICNYFDLHGGGYTVDGACSSSLLAVSSACSALAAGDLDVALAGGVDLSLDPFELVGFAQTRALAAGEMRVYDRRSAGFLPGEGCGFVALMRHEDALAQGRRVYALIRGWGISSDGSGGLTRPEVEGQLHALRRAYRRAGIGIDAVPFFEGHGTGTAVGDATELATLNRARREAGVPAAGAAIGSIKANIGHTKAAAGVASLIKACLALDRQVLPPTTGCEDPHPEIAGDDSTLRVLNRPELWPEDAPLAAGVSAMGFGGINCHVVLEGGTRRRRSWTEAERAAGAAPQDAELVVLAAASREELAARAARLAARAGGLARAELADLGARLAGDLPAGRAFRAAVVAGGPRQLKERLEILGSWLAEGAGDRLDAAAGVFLGVSREPPRIGFLFPGQGSPARLGGGRWRRRFADVDELYAGSGLPEAGDGVETSVAQPALATASVAALGVLGRLGVEASAAVGHSLGELVAYHWAGAFGARTLAAIAAVRGRAMAECGGAGAPRGAMASVGAGAAEVEELLAGLAPDAVCVTGYNSPRQTVISGLEPAVEEILGEARSRGLRATRLPVSHAFHSPLVAAAAPRLAAALAGETIAPLHRRVASTVTGGWLEGDADLEALLVRQVTSPVRFIEAVEKLAAEVDVVLEVGPGEVLTGMARRIAPLPVFALDAGGPSLAGLLEAVAALFALGAPVDAGALFRDRFVRPFDLDREPRFLANPCESAPVSESGELAAPAEARPAEARPAEARPAAEGPPVGEGSSPADVVRELITRRTELPASALSADSRLLSDLHLSSIAVGEIVTDAARRLGLPPPVAPTEYANATVAEVTRSLEELAASGPAAVRPEDALPPGVDSWLRPFTVELVERPLDVRPEAAGGAAGERAWRVFAPPGEAFAGALESALAGAGSGVALYLPAGGGEAHLELLLEAGRAARRGETFVLVHHGGGAAGFARTLHLEAPEVAVAVVELPDGVPGGEEAPWSARVAREAANARGYGEARYDRRGRRFQPVLRLLEDAGGAVRPAPLDDGDVVVVSGGGKGIGAECALALARRFGCRLALLGRSRPETDEELSANLERFADLGVVFRYLRADVTDAEAVRSAVARARAELGEPSALLHSAGTNVPRLIEVLEREDFEGTLAPKIGGLDHLLAAVDAERIKLVVGFGSIIARTGLEGEADYAYANECLRRRLEAYGRERPGCRCLCLEWSVWSGVGMGARLSRLEALGRRGIMPVAPERGVEMLLSLLERPAPEPGGEEPVGVVVSGRFGEPPTLEVERPELPLSRFLERPRVFFPGVELVADCTISSDTDPYLADHVFDAERLFPAVMGLEAMAQVWHALTGRETPPVFHRVRFERPVAVAAGESTVLRLAALARGNGRVEVALRSEKTDFKLDYFHAFLAGAESGGGSCPAHVQPVLEESATFLPLEPLDDLYGRLLFQGGRFRRLRGYRHLRATECLAVIAPGRCGAWFSSYLPAELRLGDPGMRDASIHSVQASIPHATVLPVGVERLLVSGDAPAPGPWRVTAREVARRDRTLVYDIEVRDHDGGLLERWKKLELVIVEEPRRAPLLAAPLMGPYLERRVQDFLPGARIAVAVERSLKGERHRRGDHALRELLGADAVIHRRPDGRPEAAGEVGVSTAYSGGLVLAVAGPGTVGCDVEPVATRPPKVWRDLLGRHDGLLDVVMRESGEDRDAAGTRIWTVIESAKKAGCGPDVPLVFKAATPDGWIVFSSGHHLAATVLLPEAGREEGIVFAVMVERGASDAGRRSQMELEGVSS